MAAGLPFSDCMHARIAATFEPTAENARIWRPRGNHLLLSHVAALPHSMHVFRIRELTNDSCARSRPGERMPSSLKTARGKFAAKK